LSDRLNVLNDATTRDPDISALRERAAGVLEAALGFVESHGNPFSQCRARILVELEPVERGLSLLSSHQADDGSFRAPGQVIAAPFSDALRRWDPDGALVGTLEAISVLSDWKHLYEPCVDRAIEFLGNTQSADGSWGPVGATSTEDEPMRVFATGCLAGFLGRTRSARPEMLRAAGAYMGTLWSVETIRSQGWPAVAGFAHYFTNVFDEDAEAALPWCARELERGKIVGSYTAVEVLRVLFWCEASALPGVTFDTNLLLGEILNDQHEDGGIGRAETSAEGRVASTLDAMSFIIRLCRK
jgi:hypothetical protein